MVVIKIAAVLAVIVLLLRRRVPITAAMVAGALALGLLFASGAGLFVEAVLASASDPKTLNLMAAVGGVLILSHLLQQTGQFNRIMEALSGLLRGRRARMAAMPALIGLLPMPGGARFSAPMVKAAGEGLDLDGHRLTLINYWFRHVWEYCWPLYPGLLLTAELTEIPVGRVVLAQWPLTVASIVAGILFVFPKHLPDRPTESNGQSRRGSLLRFAVEASPIVLVIAVFGLLSLVVSVAWLKNLPLLTGLAAACTLVMVRNRTGLSPLTRYVFKTPALAQMLIMVLSVMVFSGLFDRLGAAKELGAYFHQKGVPPLAAILALPFIVGLFSGVTYVYVALTFPLVVGLAPDPSPDRLIPYLAVAYAFGFVGVLLSPVHLCLLLTKDYFEADFKPIYRDLLLPSAFVAASAMLLFLLLR